jgi:hypothetical protein
MSALAAFLQELLTDGRIRLREVPRPEARSEATQAVAVLGEVFAAYRLEVAGSLVALDETVALQAAEFVRQAAWFLLHRDESAEELGQRLVMPGRPCSASQHLSADLLLRFLPTVHRRARLLDPADRLTVRLAEVLRGWPLSGVLSEVDDAPTGPLDFAGHGGLLLLYAERFAANPKPAWVPAGTALEYVELVWRELGKNPDSLPRPRQEVLGAGLAALATTGGERNDC